MIKILGFNKKYFNKTILNFKKLEFNKTGFYLIYGRSGCGKTTLLNCLSLLEDFDGDYFINEKNIKELDDEAKAVIRKEMISYVHQKPILLNDFSVFDNIKLFSNLREGEIYNHLSSFNLREKAQTPVKLLSGGEKQRISLIKSIVLEKPIILADEPTGALDKENSVFVIEKLKELSKKSLVIVVSHDVNTFKKYADCIIKVKNKTIEIEQDIIPDSKLIRQKYSNSTFSEKNIKKKYSNHIIKKRKVKNGLVSIFTSLSLICVSLTMLIAFNVRDDLINGFSQFYKPNEIVIKNRNSNFQNFKKNSPTNSEISEIESRIEDMNYRIAYNINFETFFKDANSLHLVSRYKTVKIEGYSAREFNEFKYNSAADPKYFVKSDFQSDEIAISIDNQMMLEFCYQLSITKTFNSLFNYIKNHDVYLSLYVKNFDWEYEDEQLFKLCGFVVETDKFVYHSNPLFAYHVFEEGMKLPSSIYDEIQDKPWYLKKDIVLKIEKLDRDRFLYDDYLTNFFIEKTKYNDFKTRYDKNEIINDNLYKIYKKDTTDLLPHHKIKWLDEQEYDYFTTNNYYLQNSLIQGFVNEIFLSSNSNDIDFIEDNYFKSDIDGLIKVNENLNVVSGGMLVDTQEKFYLEILDDVEENEIKISRKLYERFSKSLQNSTIFVIGLVNRYQNGSEIYKEYIKNEFKISGIAENDDRYALYGNKYFINSFFRDILGYDYQKYSSSAVNLILNNDADKENVEQYFYNFDVSEPFKQINKQINDIIFILEIVLIAFSFIVIAISIFLLTLIIKSFILDFKEDLHVLYCNGISKKQIAKIFKNYVIKTFIKAIIAVLIFNLGMSIVISMIVSESLGIGFKFNISYFSILASITIGIFMIAIGFIIVNKFIRNENIVISIRN